MATLGNFYEIASIHRTYEWKIEDILNDNLDEMYESPEFLFSGVTWAIHIYPNGHEDNETVGFIGLFLKSISVPKPVTVDVSFSLKTVDHKSDKEKTFTHLFDEVEDWGFNRFISRSNLIERQSELLHLNALTIICTIKKNETNVIADNKFLDASVQTEEGIGVWKLQQNLREISQNGDISDVILKVNGQEFKSHRCILAARSPVFSAMMKNEMKENVTGVVDIQDIDCKIFSDFLSYLYTGSTEDLASENVPQLYVAADKYQVEVLKQQCLDQMLMNISIENFCDIFMLSIQHDEEKLKETCIEYFAKHYLDIIQTCKWQSFCCENPIICNELHIKYAKLNNKNTST